MDPEDPFHPFLTKFLNLSYNASMEQEEAYANLEPATSPLAFYDRHIGSTLLCKRIEDFSTLTTTLGKVCDNAITRFYEEKHAFPLKGYRSRYATSSPAYLKDAESVYQYHDITVGHCSHMYSTRLYFDPNGPRWHSLLCMDDAYQDEKNSPFMTDKILCLFRHADFYTPSHTLTEASINRMLDIGRRYQGMAIFTFYPMSLAGQSIIKQMKSRQQFHWELSRTSGFQNRSSIRIPLDAKDSIMHHRMPARGAATRTRRTRLRKNPDCSVNTTQKRDQDDVDINSPTDLSQKKSVYVRIIRKRRESSPRLDFQLYIQRAWAIAVQKDATFLVFNCGIYERIGIRHRASQTLYISPLIEPVNCRKPSYGKLHLGLCSAATQDLLQRYEAEPQREYNLPYHRKRPIEDDIFPPCKKVKQSAYSRDTFSIAKAMSQRELALVTLFYGVYCSPVPATFLRVGSSCTTRSYKEFKPTTKIKYSSIEYMELVLDQPIGEGAVGIIHPAKVSLTLESGDTVEHKLFVKFAFSERQRNRLRNEYEIYQRLAKSDSVTGVGVVHGLFEDQDSDTLALFIDDAGRSLTQLRDENEKEEFKLSEEQRKCGKVALENIHKARIVHNDIRPANIMVDDKGQVTIIDFDAAYYMAADGTRIGVDIHQPESWERKVDEFSREQQRLDAVFDGTYTDDWDEIY